MFCHQSAVTSTFVIRCYLARTVPTRIRAGPSIFQVKLDAWFAVTSKAFQLEQGNDQTDGWYFLYPPSTAGEATDIVKDGENDVPMTDAEHVRDGQARSTTNTANPIIREPRDFVTWEMVDCIES